MSEGHSQVSDHRGRDNEDTERNQLIEGHPQATDGRGTCRTWKNTREGEVGWLELVAIIFVWHFFKSENASSGGRCKVEGKEV